LVRDRINKNEKLFDLIFMDIHMPVMDGLDAAAEIQTLNTGIPIIAMTANIMEEEKKHYEQSGMSGYLGKPFMSQELWRCLIKYFEPLSVQKEDEYIPESSDSELQLKLIKSFVRNNKNKYTEIETAIEAGDIKTAHRMVHTIKGNAGQLRMSALSEAAEDLENALKGNINLSAPEQMNLFKTELNTALEELTPIADQLNSQYPIEKMSEKTLDKTAAHDLLEELEPLLKESNSECLELVDTLRMLPGSEELIMHIENFDYEYALEALSELKKNYI